MLKLQTQERQQLQNSKLNGVIPLDSRDASHFIREKYLAAKRRHKHASFVLQVFLAWQMGLNAVLEGYSGTWIGNFSPVSMPDGPERWGGRIVMAAIFILAVLFSYPVQISSLDTLLPEVARFGVSLFLSSFVVVTVGSMFYQDSWIRVRLVTSISYLESDHACNPRYLDVSNLRRKFMLMDSGREVISQGQLLAVNCEMARIANSSRPTKWTACAYDSYEGYIPDEIKRLVERVSLLNQGVDFNVYYHLPLGWEISVADPDFHSNTLIQSWLSENHRLFADDVFSRMAIVVEAKVQDNNWPADSDSLRNKRHVIAMYSPEYGGNIPSYSVKLAEVIG